MDDLPLRVTDAAPTGQPTRPKLKLIGKRDTCGQTVCTYRIKLRMQLLFASAGIIAGIWWHDVKPKIERILQANNVLTLERAVCERINVHEMRVAFFFTTRCDNGANQLLEFDNEKENAHHRYHWCRRIITRFCDIDLMENSEAIIVNDKEQVSQARSIALRDVLQAKKIRQYVDRICHTNTNYCTFDFWESVAWWQTLLNEQTAWLFCASDAHIDQEKSVRLLNHLVRVLLQNLGVTRVERAVAILRRMPVRKIALLKRLYVEPIPGSLFASCISTIFMHNKQQHGLNTKHAATQKANGLADNTVNQKKNAALRSEKLFDAKIFLDMCASCDKREIFEIMLSVNRRVHQVDAAPCQSFCHDSGDQGGILSPILCPCETCSTLRDLANAWQYFDCGERAWLRLEFNRRFYTKVCVLLEPTVLQRKGDTRLVYTSYKNEFTTREKFVTNFVNYYSFYENNEKPLTMDKCYGKMRQMVSTIFLFANINWTLIAKAAIKGLPCNSISLNQQSLFKSMDNTLYSIFSENSIYRMSKETKQMTLSVNAPYVNRGLGAVPNCGVNAFTARIEFIFNE